MLVPVLVTVGGETTGPGQPARAAGLRAPDGIALVPTENVLLLVVALPAMAAAQRRAAVGFAVEDRIAQALDDVQVVLGPQMAPGVWLVAVTARSVLSGLAKTDPQALLWPDVLLVPVPRAGWAVLAEPGRVLVRLPDGTGFATSAAAWPAFWAAAGSPGVTLFGGVLPATVPVVAQGDLPATADPALSGFDLRAGLPRSGGGQFLSRGARHLLAVCGVAMLAHLTLLVVDVTALARLAGQREQDLRAELNAPPGSDLDLLLAQALVARQPTDQSGVLGLLSGTFAAIAAEAGRVSVQTLRYAAAEDAAVLTLEAPDLATLQAVESALAAAGLGVTAGAATTRDGAAEVQMTIRGGGT